MSTQNNTVDYYIDKEKRTIAAVLHVPSTEICDELMNIMNKKAGGLFTITQARFEPSMLLTGIYRGKCKAHPDDEWDEEAGKRLAYLRARKAYAKERLRIIKMVAEVTDDIDDTVEDSVEFTENLVKGIKRDIDAFFAPIDKQ